MAVEREAIRGSLWESSFRNTPFWRDASETALDTLVESATIHRCRKGEVLFAEGTKADRILVVLNGYARGLHYETSGHVVVLEVLGAGDMIGTVSALADAPFEGDVEAGVDTVVAWFPISALEAIIGSSPEVAMSVVRSMARRWVAVVAAGKRNAATVPARLARYLAELPRAQVGPSSYRVRIPTTRVELAATLATSPETLSRAFHKLRSDGLVEDSGRSVTVLDDLRLRTVAEGDSHSL